MSTEKNLLLVSMSTLSSDKASEKYYHGEIVKQQSEGKKRDCYFCGVSQQEVGTKYYLRSLQEAGKKLDKIFIVETPETRDLKLQISVLQKFLQEDERYVFLKEEEQSQTTSAVRFYKERIYQYIRGFEKVADGSPVSDIQKACLDYENCVEKIYYSEDEIINTLFCDIEINEVKGDQKAEQNALFNGIKELCDQIQEFAVDDATDAVDEATEVKLYLYMQGGSRHAASLINAAINMLRMRGIKVESSVITDFDYAKNDGKHTQAGSSSFEIIDSTLNDRIFEMVSGMNEFIATGRGDTLLSFCDNSKDLIYLTPERDMIEAIRRISKAISLCNVNSFNSAIKNFNEEVKKYDDINLTNSLFKIFVKDLKDDYNKFHLLEDTKSPTIDQVSWCLDKKLYQQALTLLEAHVPDDIVKNKIIYYGGETYDEVEKQLRNLLDILVDAKRLKVDSCYLGKDKKVKTKYLNYIWIHNAMQPKFNKSSDEYNWTLKLPQGWSRSSIDDQQNNNNLQIGTLLKRYSNICKIRNAINHSDDKVMFSKNNIQSITTELLEYHIMQLIECYNKLLKDSIRVDISRQVTAPQVAAPVSEPLETL